MCPQCKFYIEKNGGCKHMTCQKCNHQFCWVCRSKWGSHNARSRKVLCAVHEINNKKFWGPNTPVRAATKAGALVLGVPAAAAAAAVAGTGLGAAVVLIKSGKGIRQLHRECKRKRKERKRAKLRETMGPTLTPARIGLSMKLIAGYHVLLIGFSNPKAMLARWARSHNAAALGGRWASNIGVHGRNRDGYMFYDLEIGGDCAGLSNLVYVHFEPPSLTRGHLLAQEGAPPRGEGEGGGGGWAADDLPAAMLRRVSGGTLPPFDTGLPRFDLVVVYDGGPRVSGGTLPRFDQSWAALPSSPSAEDRWPAGALSTPWFHREEGGERRRRRTWAGRLVVPGWGEGAPLFRTRMATVCAPSSEGGGGGPSGTGGGPRLRRRNSSRVLAGMGGYRPSSLSGSSTTSGRGSWSGIHDETWSEADSDIEEQEEGHTTMTTVLKNESEQNGGGHVSFHQKSKTSSGGTTNKDAQEEKNQNGCRLRVEQDEKSNTATCSFCNASQPHRCCGLVFHGKGSETDHDCNNKHSSESSLEDTISNAPPPENSFFFSDWSWAQGLTLMEEEQERGAAWVAGLNSNNTTVPITNDPGSVRSTSFRRATPCQPQTVPKEINRALPLNIIKQLHIGVPHDAVLNRIEREGIRKEEGQAWTLDDLFLEMDLEELKENETTCPGRHGLSEFPTPSPMWYCSRCYSKTGKQTGHPQGTIFYGCRTCDFDLCRVCYKELESAKARQEKTNDGQMAAVWSLDDVEEGDDGDEESGEDDDLLLEDAPFELLGVLIQKAIETTQWEVRSALVESGL